MPNGAQYVSGKDECIKSVREQISKGAEWIKVFLDLYTFNNEIRTTFTSEELAAIVESANNLDVAVACYAMSKDAINLAINSGVRSIEHGDEFDSDLIDKAISKHVFWCPTISVIEYYEEEKIL